MNEFYESVHFEKNFWLVFYEPLNCFKWKTYILLVIISNHFLLISNYFEFTLLSKVKFMIRLKMLKFNLLFEQKIIFKDF
jgi:hypothetical protein